MESFERKRPSLRPDCQASSGGRWWRKLTVLFWRVTFELHSLKPCGTFLFNLLFILLDYVDRTPEVARRLTTYLWRAAVENRPKTCLYPQTLFMSKGHFIRGAEAPPTGQFKEVHLVAASHIFVCTAHVPINFTAHLSWKFKMVLCLFLSVNI